MKALRFALTRRWAGYLVLTLAFAAACVLLGRWQLARREEALTAIRLVEQNFDAAPVPLADALEDLDAYDPAQEWTPVLLHGRYLDDEQLLARNRPRNGSPGFEVLTPLLLDSGEVFVVDRGWLPIGSEQDEPDEVPPPPEGEVTVVARLKAGEPTLPGRSAPAGQIATVHLPEIAELVDQPTYTAAYGLLASEDPAPSTRPAAVTRPEPDEGPHLSYAFQWIAFAVLGFLGLGWAVRREYALAHADDPAVRRRTEQAARRQGRSDAAEEDALLDR